MGRGRIEIIVVLAFLLVVTTLISNTKANEIETFNATRVDLSRSETTLISRDSAWLGLASTQKMKKVESLHEVGLGDSLEIADQPFRVGTIEVSRFLKDSSYGGENLGRKGEDVCVIWETAGQAPYLDEDQGVGHRWLKIRNCKVLESKNATQMGTDLDALREYGNAVGVRPAEFVRFSASEQEAYVRGVMDGQVFLREFISDPDVGAFINCLNDNLTAIISRAGKFLQSEGEQEFLVPWSLARLVGKACPKETRLSDAKSIQYTQATTEETLMLMVTDQDEKKAAQKQNAIDRAFIRGVLDGKVFYFFNHRHPKLKEYLSCISQPGSLNKILSGMRMVTMFGDNLNEPRTYHVAQGEGYLCKDLK